MILLGRKGRAKVKKKVEIINIVGVLGLFVALTVLVYFAGTLDRDAGN